MKKRAASNLLLGIYCLSKKSWQISYSNLLHKMGQDFLDKQWLLYGGTIVCNISWARVKVVETLIFRQFLQLWNKYNQCPKIVEILRCNMQSQLPRTFLHLYNIANIYIEMAFLVRSEIDNVKRFTEIKQISFRKVTVLAAWYTISFIYPGQGRFLDDCVSGKSSVARRCWLLYSEPV